MAENGDILLLPQFVDTYRYGVRSRWDLTCHSPCTHPSPTSNLPQKLLAWLRYGALSRAKLLLKTDDDVIVDVER